MTLLSFILLINDKTTLTYQRLIIYKNSYLFFFEKTLENKILNFLKNQILFYKILITEYIYITILYY